MQKGTLMSTALITNFSILNDVHIPDSTTTVTHSSADHHLNGRSVLFPLSDEMELYVLSFLPYKDLLICDLVSMRFNRLSSSGRIWEQVKNREFTVGLGLVKQINWKTTFQIQKWWYEEREKCKRGEWNNKLLG
jgi:hypothetical protein